MNQHLLLTRATYVLLVIAEDPRASLEEIAAKTDISAKQVLRLIGELEDSGCIARTRDGKRNRYAIRSEAPIPGSDASVGDLLRTLTPPPKQ